MDGDTNSDINDYLFAADGATRRCPEVINPRLFLPGRPRGEVPVTAGHQFVRAAGAGAISLKSFFQKDFKETAMWRIIYIADPPPLTMWSPRRPPAAGVGTWGRGRPQLRPIYIICASGEGSVPRCPHEVYWRNPGDEKADGTRRLGSIAGTMRVLEPQIAPQNRHRGCPRCALARPSAHLGAHWRALARQGRTLARTGAPKGAPWRAKGARHRHGE